MTHNLLITLELSANGHYRQGMLPTQGCLDDNNANVVDVIEASSAGELIAGASSQALAPQPRNLLTTARSLSWPVTVRDSCVLLLLAVSKADTKDSSSTRLFNTMLDRAKTLIRTLKQALNQRKQDLVLHPT